MFTIDGLFQEMFESQTRDFFRTVEVPDLPQRGHPFRAGERHYCTAQFGDLPSWRRRGHAGMHPLRRLDNQVNTLSTRAQVRPSVTAVADLYNLAINQSCEQGDICRDRGTISCKKGVINIKSLIIDLALQ